MTELHQIFFACWSWPWLCTALLGDLKGCHLWILYHYWVLWCCWLGSRKGIWPVKKWWVLVWLSAWDEVEICIWLSWCHCLTDSCSSLIQIGFTFLVPAHPGSPGQSTEGRKTVVLLSIMAVTNQNLSWSACVFRYPSHVLCAAKPSSLHSKLRCLSQNCCFQTQFCRRYSSSSSSSSSSSNI